MEDKINIDTHNIFRAYAHTINNNNKKLFSVNSWMELKRKLQNSHNGMRAEEMHRVLCKYCDRRTKTARARD